MNSSAPGTHPPQSPGSGTTASARLPHLPHSADTCTLASITLITSAAPSLVVRVVTEPRRHAVHLIQLVSQPSNRPEAVPHDHSLP